MGWIIEYYEQQEAKQPAEIFEDDVEQAAQYWQDYQITHKTSPLEEENDESL